MIATKRNLFTAGIVLGAHGGAFVVVEKCPRKTGRTERVRHAHGPEIEETWEDVLSIVAAQRLAGRLTDMLDCVGEYLSHTPLKDDCVAFVEAALLGDGLARLLAERDAGVGRIILVGDVEACDPKTGEWTVPLSVLQARITLLFETRRIEVSDELGDGPNIIRALERLDGLPDSGPTRDLAIATAIAVWSAEKYPSAGPWASSKAPPLGSEAAQSFEEREALRREALEERAQRRRGGRLRSRLRGTPEVGS